MSYYVTANGEPPCLPRDGHSIAIAHGAEGDDAPPERMRKAGKVLVVVLLHHVDDKGGEDEDDEADVHSRDQLLYIQEWVLSGQSG